MQSFLSSLWPYFFPLFLTLLAGAPIQEALAFSPLLLLPRRGSQNFLKHPLRKGVSKRKGSNFPTEREGFLRKESKRRTPFFHSQREKKGEQEKAAA